MEKLLEKEREVAERLASLKDRQAQVMQALAQLQPNWPPKCCCIEPIVYHDIDRAVPTDRISFAKWSYGVYFFTIFVLIYNLICCIIGVAQIGSTGYAVHCGIGVIHLLGIPGAFLLWHFQVYTALQHRGSLNRYGLAYLGVGIAFLYTIFMALGLVGYGGAGWLFAFSMRGSGDAGFIMSIISAAFWTIKIFFFFFMFIRLRRYHLQDKAAKPSIAGITLPI